MTRNEKSLSERIAERERSKKNYQNKTAFLAIRDEVKQALTDDWPVKVIWETLHAEKKISFGYDAFINYVNRLIRHSQKNNEVSENNPQTPEKCITKKSPPLSLSGFRFESTPNKKDLL